MSMELILLFDGLVIVVKGILVAGKNVGYGHAVF